MAQVRLHDSWKSVLGDEFDKPYMKDLRAFLAAEKAASKIIYPQPANWFKALDSTPFEDVRVVILGQDPYHGPGQAEGLAFSVPDGVPLPPSLRNIYQELREDLSIQTPESGSLQAWADRGVLLLNATLTVEAQRAGSHQNKGWEIFTDRIVELLNEQRNGLVFLLWGSYAQRKGAAISRDRHGVFMAPHPSPLSAYRGFFGSRPFSQTNQWLSSRGYAAMDWRLD